MTAFCAGIFSNSTALVVLKLQQRKKSTRGDDTPRLTNSPSQWTQHVRSFDCHCLHHLVVLHCLPWYYCRCCFCRVIEVFDVVSEFYDYESEGSDTQGLLLLVEVNWKRVLVVCGSHFCGSRMLPFVPLFRLSESRVTLNKLFPFLNFEG